MISRNDKEITNMKLNYPLMNIVQKKTNIRFYLIPYTFQKTHHMIVTLTRGSDLIHTT